MSNPKKKKEEERKEMPRRTCQTEKGGRQGRKEGKRENKVP